MGKTTGFLDYQRENDRALPPSKRIESFREFHIALTEKERRQQAARCMDCGVPFCQSGMKLHGMVSGCPLHNLIPEWNDQIYQGHYEHAFVRLRKTNNFPEFTGRVCPALCEKACINGEYGEAVTIHNNELFLIEKAFSEGWMKPQIPKVRSGKKVAVVGAGPAGLSVADELNHRGHSVTVLEREEEIGGLLMFGIPNMKLDKTVIRRRRVLMEAEGVHFLCNVNVGKDDKWTPERLLKDFDAVVLCCGAKAPRALPQAPVQPGNGIYYAVDFLSETTRALLKASDSSRSAKPLRKDLHRKNSSFVSAKDKHVVVIGGGDTGNDCIGTVIREGCKSVTALEMLPAPPVSRSPENPWPEWPKVLKTDYGHEEAKDLFGQDPRIFETTVKEVFYNKKGEIKELTTVKLRFENGTFREIPGTEKKLKCDLLLIAAGFIGCEGYTAEAFSLQLGKRQTVLTKPEQYLSSQPKVFTAGDMHRGQSLVVWAITEGRACAYQVDQFLMGYTNLAER